MEPNEMFNLLNDIPIEGQIVKKNKAIMPAILISIAIISIGYLVYKKHQRNELKKE